MPGIATLQDNLRDYEGQVATLVASGDNDAAREMSGRIALTRELIMDAASEIEAENRSLRESGAAVQAEAASVGARVLGNIATFTGLQNGWQGRAPIGNSMPSLARLSNAVSGLTTPQIYRYDIHGPVAPPTGFLATIPKGATEGDEHFYRTPVLTNNAAGWTSGNKPESALEWTPAVANLETIAHWMPIKRQTANRYKLLDSIVSNSLMLGLDLRCDDYVLRGSNSSGIVGVLNTTGILVHKKASGKNIKDTLAAMKRKVRVATGIAPTHVCLSPYAIEELSEEKDTTGRYLFPDIANGGTIAGLIVVEDVNMTKTTVTTLGEGESATTTTTVKEEALVYYPAGASFDVADPEEVIIGLKDSQLIQNEYTILAETTACLRVDIPGCFCHCQDLGIAVEA